jgi:transcriptional regulator GlxA family with amidase domain
LRAFQPATTVLADTRIVDEGEVITSAGVSAGIDMALHVVRRLHGDGIARATARDMEYDWRTDEFAVVSRK